MDLIKQQYLRIVQQLSGLSATQKMLVFSLLAVMGLTLTLWLRYAASREQVALFDTPLSQVEINNVSLTLSSRGIAHEVVAGRVMVATEKQQLATAILAQEQAIPGNVLNSFEQMFAAISPWESQAVFSERLKQARNNWLVSTIRLWDGVVNATVQINPAEKRGLRESSRPSASVSVRTKGNLDPDKRRKMAANIAWLVNGLVPMSRNDMGIIIDSEAMVMRDDSDSALAGGSDIVEHQRKIEQQEEDKIRRHFQEVAGLQVMVKVELNTKSMRETRKEVDPKSKIQIAKRESNETIASTDGSGPQEPGAVPNQGLDLANASASASSNSSTAKEETENVVDYNSSETTIQTPAGDYKLMAVSLRVPRSHFVNIWMRNQPMAASDAKPADTDLMMIETATLAEMRQSLAIVMQSDVAATQVLAYTDVPFNTPSGDGVLMASASSGMTLYVTSYAREVAIASLAVVSLFMVTRMVKRSVPPPPVLNKAKESMGPQQLEATSEVAGIAAEGDNVLVGREIDEQVVAAKQMIEQVQTLVTENPDAAASLVKKWLVRA